MKAISAVALSAPLTGPQLAAAGVWVSALVLFLSATRTLSFITRLLPLPLIRGIQLGTGLQLINNGIAAILKANWWRVDGYRWTDNMVVAGLAFAVAMGAFNARKSWTALALFAFGLAAALVRMYGFEGGAGGAKVGPAFWMPFVPSWEDYKTAFFQASLGQLPLTILNSVVAVCKLADDLYPDRPHPVASITAMGSCVGLMNLLSAWFGSVPYCHGSGGLAGQYRFGARTHVSVVFLGTLKILLGLVFGSALLKLLDYFPNTVLGVMLVLAGLEIASMIKDLGDPSDPRGSHTRFVVALVTGATCAAWKHDGVGFLVGWLGWFVMWCGERREKGVGVVSGVVEAVRGALREEAKEVRNKGVEARRKDGI
ncbi:hypothetical protein HDU96_003591 [Phlyctochytrium bullatum]|nr:hypothetical protein HDU96_003591 [Phlyctochytrium bullatum]